MDIAEVMQLVNRGQTVIDCVFTGPNATAAVVDFDVKEISKSDHQPCTVTLFVEGSHVVQINQPPAVAIEKIKWNPYNARTFKNALESMTVPHSHSTDILYQAIRDSIVAAATEANMVQVYKPKSNCYASQPWFDRECRLANAKVNKALRYCKKHGFTDENTKNYLQHKNDARILQKNKKKQHYSKLQDNIWGVKNPRDFWKAVKKLLIKRSRNHARLPKMIGKPFTTTLCLRKGPPDTHTMGFFVKFMTLSQH